jgi:hypothetical protein
MYASLRRALLSPFCRNAERWYLEDETFLAEGDGDSFCRFSDPCLTVVSRIATRFVRISYSGSVICTQRMGGLLLD